MRRHSTSRLRFALGWILLGILAASMAAAQGPGGPPPPMGGPGGPPPPFGRPRLGPPPATVAHVPLALLGAKLTLTADQNARITQIQSDLRRQMNSLMPRHRPGPAGPPPRPSRPGDRRQVRMLDNAASRKIMALLTAAQKKALPGVLAEMDALRADGFPLQICGDLKLTAEQEAKLIAIGRTADRTRAAVDFRTAAAAMGQAQQRIDAEVMAVLTASQRRVLGQFRRDHPRPGPGFGGPPPPDGIGPPPGF